ncbi:MAG: hypothetical protein ABSC18_16540 [Verrucomicrobiota bacterium]|jgi:type II secretory pathway pseudopilin PulG
MKTPRANFKSTIAAAPPRAPGRLASAPPPPHSSHSSHPLPSQAAFTMIEIAIALGIIGFALVAIIGILPAGLNAQRESHQDITIGQDGDFFLEAIRNGGPALGPGTSTSLDFLTNYVESITVGANTYNQLPSGQVILGLLSTPSTQGNVTARIRGLTGAATEQNGSNAATAFRYSMNVEIEPFPSVSTNSLDTINGVLLANEAYLSHYLYDLRLKFSWPVNAVTGKVGPGRQTYRTLVSGYLLRYTNSVPALWFFQPNTYTNL